jgi:nitrite reductase (NO-forming)
VSATPTPSTQEPGTPRDRWIVLAVTVAAISMLAAFVAAGIAARDGGSSGVAAGGTETFEISLTEMAVTPASIEVPAGTEVVVNVTNDGTMPHDLALDGEVGTAMLDPGESEEVSLGVVEATTQAWCTVPGHKDAGMVMDIVVTGGADTGVALASGQGDAYGDTASWDAEAAPSAEFVPRDPRAPVPTPGPGGTVHEIAMRATETVIEVAPGVTQEVWTFDDQVPGPILRGKVGDVFILTITNEGVINHSMDFHSSKVAWSDEMQDIAPGESIEYEFEAKHAGYFMYHCGTAPALHHIGNGMFGGMIIDPPDLPAVDHELAMVQSEYYFGPEGEPGSLAKMQDEAFDAVVFNGYANQYVHEPIAEIEPGERVRVWVLDAGPSENSSFHIVGTIFDTVFKEGDYTLVPGPGQGGAQALDLQPAQGGFVEMTFDEPGRYLMVTHKFSNVGKGALGFIDVGDFELPEGAGGH